MIVLGANSEVAQAFVEKTLLSGEKFENVFLSVLSIGVQVKPNLKAFGNICFNTAHKVHS